MRLGTHTSACVRRSGVARTVVRVSNPNRAQFPALHCILISIGSMVKY